MRLPSGLPASWNCTILKLPAAETLFKLHVIMHWLTNVLTQALYHVVAVTVTALFLPLLSKPVAVPLAVAEPSHPAPAAVVCRWRSTAWAARVFAGERVPETSLERAQACVLSH
jgi:hypothetical protein